MKAIPRGEIITPFGLSWSKLLLFLEAKGDCLVYKPSLPSLVADETEVRNVVSFQLGQKTINILISGVGG